MNSGTNSGQPVDDPDHDFTWRHYREILAAITASHRTFSFTEAAAFGVDLLQQGRFVVMRHDVEFSLDAAVTMAEADAAAGVRSTFFLQYGSDYNLFEARGIAQIQRLLELGHDLGLHYDVRLFEQSGADPSVLARSMIALMEATFETTVRVASPHMPMRSGRTLEIPGVVDAYAPLYFRDLKYLSDSTQAWREGVVTGLLDRYDQIHLLTHEYHWSDEGHGFDVLLLREAMAKYRRLHEQAEENIVRFREGLRMRAERDRAFREQMGGRGQ